MAFWLKKILIFSTLMWVFLLLAGCSLRNPLDELAWLPTSAVAVFFPDNGGEDTIAQAVPWMHYWEQKLGLVDVARVRCRVSADTYEWLILGKSATEVHLDPALVAKSWKYNGVTLSALQAGNLPTVYAGKWMGVFFLAPRAILLEEVVERRFSFSGKWKQARNTFGKAERQTLFWDASFPSSDWLPAATGISGVLSSGYASADSNGYTFRFSASNWPSNRTLVHFPYGMIALVPEDARAFLFPFYPGALPNRGLLAAGMESPYPLRIQVYSGENEQLSALLLFRMAWGGKDRAGYYRQMQGAELAYRSFRFVQLNDEALASLKPTLGTSAPWALEADGMLLLAGDPALLERWVDYYQAGAMMTKQLAPLFPSPETRALYWSCHRLPEQLPDWMAKYLPVGDRVLSGLVADGNQWKLHVQRLETPGVGGATALVWRQTLGTGVIQFFPLPGRPEMLVQTADFNVYLLDSAQGNILFRFNPGQPLLGAPYFCTESESPVAGWLMHTREAIFKLNEHGDLFPGFPIRLRVPAVAALTFQPGYAGRGGVFFYPAQNGHIYGYQLNGIPLNAWNPGPDMGELVGKLVVFEDSGKDFIGGLSKTNGLFVLDATAKPHFPSAPVPVSADMALHLELNGLSKRLVTRSQDGRVWVLSLRGEHFPLPVRNAAGALFGFGQLAGDERQDYLIAAADGSVVLSGYREQSFEVFWKVQMGFAPDQVRILATASGPCLAIENKRRRTWTLLNGQGQELPGSPVGGSLDIAWSGTRHLITALDNSVVCWTIPDAL